VVKREQKRQLFSPIMIWEMKGTSPMFRVWEIAEERCYKSEVRKRVHDKKLLDNKKKKKKMYKSCTKLNIF
jgi:hypothetical protein